MKNFAIAFLLLFASVQGAFDANLLKQELSKLDETTSSTIQALIEEGEQDREELEEEEKWSSFDIVTCALFFFFF